MKVKTSELTGAALDYAVAMCEDIAKFSPLASSKYHFAPSKSWQQGGTIIEREKINLHFCCDLRDVNGKYVHASINTNLYHGYCKGHDTPLIAAMRCYVASKMGEEIEIPEGLI